MSYAQPRAAGSTFSRAPWNHVRDTAIATLLFFLALGFAAVASAPAGGGTDGPDWMDTPRFTAGA